ncbi:MAG: SIMPL domain-containing protein [Thermaerobacter sp.]|nr:SIMPL domain-containing protein [Thermaerobacter sp.]
MRLSHRTTLSMLALMTLTGAVLTFGPRHGAAAASETVARTLTVTEEEPITAPGQGAMLYLGLETKAADSRSAQSDARQALERLRQGLRAAGVPAADVQVTGYRIGATTRAAEAGATVWQNLRVQVATSEKLGQAIDAAVASGATLVQGTLGQGLAPKQGQRAAAVASAVRAARSDAQAIAGALGEKLGRPVAVEVHMQPGGAPGGRYIMQVRVTFSG